MRVHRVDPRHRDLERDGARHGLVERDRHRAHHVVRAQPVALIGEAVDDHQRRDGVVQARDEVEVGCDLANKVAQHDVAAFARRDGEADGRDAVGRRLHLRVHHVHAIVHDRDGRVTVARVRRTGDGAARLQQLQVIGGVVLAYQRLEAGGHVVEARGRLQMRQRLGGRQRRRGRAKVGALRRKRRAVVPRALIVGRLRVLGKLVADVLRPFVAHAAEGRLRAEPELVEEARTLAGHALARRALAGHVIARSALAHGAEANPAGLARRLARARVQAVGRNRRAARVAERLEDTVPA
mmetsp:Transcript_60767/g.166505  ORF Transcript_60767/g.166505 Transcript_60767/m.166505 type:complete len:296 (-) Transcript_60767:588-1475(-)